MRQLALLCTLLAAPILALGQNGGQATVISGYASNWVVAPGAYALPNPPLVNTPMVSLDAVPVSPVGASNATAGNVAGATNATLSMVSQPVSGPFAASLWYGSSTASEAPEDSREAHAQAHRGNYLNLGIATFQDSESVARLMAEEHFEKKHAPRVYTNQDVAQLVEQLNQSRGLVKYDGKTEHLN
jgi:hypothetical protein